MTKPAGFLCGVIFLSGLSGVCSCGSEAKKSGADMGADMGVLGLAGSWLSQGADVAPLLSGMPFNYTKITATFMASTYTVLAVDNTTKQTTFTGTWVSSASDKPGILNIDLNQSQPSMAVSKGIYQIDATMNLARMTYEVVQVQPDIHVSPPTAAMGFGSTQNGMLGMTNVQKYVRTGN